MLTWPNNTHCLNVPEAEWSSALPLTETPALKLPVTGTDAATVVAPAGAARASASTSDGSNRCDQEIRCIASSFPEGGQYTAQDARRRAGIPFPDRASSKRCATHTATQRIVGIQSFTSARPPPRRAEGGNPVPKYSPDGNEISHGARPQRGRDPGGRSVSGRASSARERLERTSRRTWSSSPWRSQATSRRWWASR